MGALRRPKVTTPEAPPPASVLSDRLVREAGAEQRPPGSSSRRGSFITKKGGGESAPAPDSVLTGSSGAAQTWDYGLEDTLAPVGGMAGQGLGSIRAAMARRRGTY